MFNKDFFPTPKHVIEQMVFNIDLNNKTILEPSAGNGEIIDYIKQFSPKQVLCCEKEPDLAKICSQKADRFLCHDFFDLSKEDISYVDLILMNPPFSADEKHILHAWEILPEGAEFVSLCNWNTYDIAHTRERRMLKNIIFEHGKINNIGNVFKFADRETDVSIGLIYLSKPKGDSKDEFEGYFDLSEDKEQIQQEGLMSFNGIRDIVNRYVAAVKMFDETIAASEKMNKLISPINDNVIRFGAQWTGKKQLGEVNRDIFKKELQKSAWRSLFKIMDMQKYVTSSVISDINKFVEQQEHVPFKESNVYKMFEVIWGTRESRMNKVIVEVFDSITARYHENRFQLEGWKTNSEYRVNKKFIMYCSDVHCGYSGNAEASYRNPYFMDDLTKALCFVTGTNYDKCDQWWHFMNNAKKFQEEREYRGNDGKIVKYMDDKVKNTGREWGKWHEFNFFRFKVYKKGTIHCEFIDEKVWDEFNKIACKAKGFMLASKFTSDFRQKTNDIVKI